MSYRAEKWPRQPRRVEQCRRIVVAHAQPDQVGIEGTQAGAQARVAARLVAMPGAPAQVVEQAGTVDALQPAAGTVAPARQLFQIAPIGVLGLPRQPVLGPGRFDEARNRPRIGIAQRRQRMGQAAAVGGGQSSGRHGAQDSRRLPVSCAAMNAPPPPDSAALLPFPAPDLPKTQSVKVLFLTLVTLLTVFVVPTVYSLLARRRVPGAITEPVLAPAAARD